MCSLYHITRLLSAGSTYAQGHTATRQVRHTINAAQLMQCSGNSKRGAQEFLNVPRRCGNCSFSHTQVNGTPFTVPHHHLTTTPNVPRVTTSVACSRAGTAMPRLPLLTPLKLGSSESLPSSSLLQPRRCRRLCPLLGTATEPVTTTLHRYSDKTVPRSV
jgi:hypothetical protein